MVIGQKTMFVRTAGCDYSCSWCDSRFTWDGSSSEQIKMMSAEEIWNELKSQGGNSFSYVTISGGNPALLQHLGSLVDLLKEKGVAASLETQGSKWQDWFHEIDALTISPKPPSSGMLTNFKILDEIIYRLKEHSSYSLKVVVFDSNDYEYAKAIHKRYPGVPFFLQVGNSQTILEDENELAKVLLEQYIILIEKVMSDPSLNDVKVLPQLHTLLWGNRRGV